MSSKKRRGRASEETRPVADGQAGKAITARKSLSPKSGPVKPDKRRRGVKGFLKHLEFIGGLSRTGKEAVCSDCLSHEEKLRLSLSRLICLKDIVRIPKTALVCRRCGNPLFLSGAMGLYLKKSILDGVEKALAKKRRGAL